jgi:hypothetical protein
VAYCEYFEGKSEAMMREKVLKTGKGRDWIKVNITNWLSVFDQNASF